MHLYFYINIVTFTGAPCVYVCVFEFELLSVVTCFQPEGIPLVLLVRQAGWQ